MIELKLTQKELFRIQLSLETAINEAEDFLKEAGGDYPVARIKATKVINECKDLQEKLIQPYSLQIKKEKEITNG